MKAWMFGALAATALLSTGCGPNCQSSCNRIFNTSECDIRVPGQSTSISVRDCIESCDNALDQPGDLEGYNPFEANTSGATVALDNEKKAALWMECIETTSCEDIDDGFCAPTSF